MITLLLLNLAFMSWIIIHTTHMEKRLMSQIDDLRQGEADLKQAISDAGDRVVAKLDALQAKLDNAALTQPQQEDLTSDIQALKDDVSALAKIGADAAPAPATVPVAVGDTIGVPTDPTDPESPVVDHTVTNIGADGSITAEPATDASSGQDSSATQTETPAETPTETPAT